MGKITEFDKDYMVSSLMNYYNVMCAVEERAFEIAKMFDRVESGWEAIETWFDTIDDIYCVCIGMAKDNDRENIKIFKCPVAWLYSDKFNGPLYSKIKGGEI